MGIWRYRHFDPSTRKTIEGFPYKNPEILSDTQPDSDYDLIDSIVGIYELTQDHYQDYMQWRDTIKNKIESVPSWVGLTDKEKDITIELDIGVNTNEKVVYLMGKGMMQIKAISFIVKSAAHHHVLDVATCKARAEDEYVIEIIFSFLSLTDGSVFFRLVQNLFYAYTSQAIKGTQDGLVGEGLFDFIESTPGTSKEFAGLESQGFTMANGDPDETNFIYVLMQWFRHGIKTI